MHGQKNIKLTHYMYVYFIHAWELDLLWDALIGSYFVL